MLADPGADRTKVTARLLIWEHRRVWDLSREGRRAERLVGCYPCLGHMGFKLSHKLLVWPGENLGFALFPFLPFQEKHL